MILLLQFVLCHKQTPYFPQIRTGCKSGTSQAWGVTNMEWDHNHQPSSDMLVAYSTRKQHLTNEMKVFLERLLANNITPVDVQRVFETSYQDGPIVTVQDLANMAKHLGMRGGSEDANALLQLLHDRARNDSRWFIRSSTTRQLPNFGQESANSWTRLCVQVQA